MIPVLCFKHCGRHSRTVNTPLSCFNADEEAIKEENGLAMHYHDNMQGRSLRL